MTGLLISLLHNRYVHVPIRLAVSQRNRIDPDGSLWRDVTEATGQPLLLKERRAVPRKAANKRQVRPAASAGKR